MHHIVKVNQNLQYFYFGFFFSFYGQDVKVDIKTILLPAADDLETLTYKLHNHNCAKEPRNPLHAL